jgi:hypothetical protein
MTEHDAVLAQRSREGVSLRGAALLAGGGLLATLLASPFAHLYVMPRLVITSDMPRTLENLQAQPGLFLAAIFALLITFLADFVIAWSLWLLLAPVNRAVSSLTALLRVVYTAIAMAGLAKLFVVYRLLTTPDYASIVGEEAVAGQVYLLLRMFRTEWYVGFAFFSLHLVLLGWLVYRSGYIPRLFGPLLALNGIGYALDWLRPYLFPTADIGWIMILFFGEVFFMIWLLARGWRLPGSDRAVPAVAGVAQP